MNKQILVAGLLGAASAAAAAGADNCINPAVEKATEAHTKAVQAHADEQAKTAGLVTASETAAAAWDPVSLAVAPRAAARGALAAAAASAKTASDLRASQRQSATDKVSEYTASLGAAQGALDDAVALVEPQEQAIADDQAVYDELSKAVTDHDLLVAAADTTQIAKGVLNVAAGTAYTNAVTAWNTLRVGRAEENGKTDAQEYSAVDGTDSGTAGVGAADGSARVLALATAATGTAKSSWEGQEAAVNTLFTNWQPKKAALANATTYNAAVIVGCMTNACDAQTDSPVKAQKAASAINVASGTAFTESGTLETLYEGESSWRYLLASPYTVTAPLDADTGSKGQAGRWANWARLTAVEAGKKKLDDDAGVVIGTAAALVISTLNARDEAVTGTAAVLAAAESAYDSALALRNADNDQLPTAKLGLDASNAAIVTFREDVVVKTYLKALETAKLAQANADLAVYSSQDAADWATLRDGSATALSSADAALSELEAELSPFTIAKTDAAQDVTDNTGAIAAREQEVQAAAAALAMAISICKGNGYDRAQEALRDSLAKQELDRTTALQIKTDYEAKAAFAPAGAVNFPCAMKDVEGTMTRPACAEGQCCGAAQKFRRDGTKLTVETCQEEIGTHTYTYFPPLPADATVEPTPETWRFQCISGAQKLVAATAAVAAAFAMA